MVTSLTEKRLLQRSAAVRFVQGLLFLLAPAYIAAQLALAFPDQASSLALAAVLGKIIGLALMASCVSDLAASKGRSRWYGLLVLLGPLGLIWAVGLYDFNFEPEWTPRVYRW